MIIPSILPPSIFLAVRLVFFVESMYESGQPQLWKEIHMNVIQKVQWRGSHPPWSILRPWPVLESFRHQMEPYIQASFT